MAACIVRGDAISGTDKPSAELERGRALARLGKNTTIAPHLRLCRSDAQLLRNLIRLQIRVHYPKPCVRVRTGRIVIVVGLSLHAERKKLSHRRLVT